eukprot:TRINITY_DN37850_c0_g1_i1.p1 TRINITY_DN37850_c0_g1~~TRINITY_DN37850_c0_g1_i1.p1  ORF type:complete len:390 (+),score=84.93 TRINITY_DN37850_c0_g1_i1:57-1226(+)
MATLHETCAADYESYKKKLMMEKEKKSKFLLPAATSDVDGGSCPTADLIRKEMEEYDSRAAEDYWDQMQKKARQRQKKPAATSAASSTATKPLWQIVNDTHKRHISSNTLRVIFSFLNYQDLLQITSVSRLWCTSSENDYLWKNLCHFYGVSEPAGYSWKLSLKSFITRTNNEGSPATLTDELAVIKKSLFAELTSTPPAGEEQKDGVAQQKRFKERLAVLQNDAVDRKVDDMLSYVNEEKTEDGIELDNIFNVSEYSDHLSDIEANKINQNNAAAEIRDSAREISVLLNASKRRRLLSQFEAKIALETGNPQATSFSMLEHHSIVNPTAESSTKWFQFRDNFPLNVYYDIVDAITTLSPSSSSLRVASETSVIDIINSKLSCSILNCV